MTCCLRIHRSQIEELSLKCQGETRLKVLFGEPWLVQTTHMKLKGTVPCDREYNVLTCSAGETQASVVLKGAIDGRCL